MPLYSHSATDRNRVKRRLREIVRMHVLPALVSGDLLLRALPSAYQASFAVLRAQCLQLGSRAAMESGGG